MDLNNICITGILTENVKVCQNKGKHWLSFTLCNTTQKHSSFVPVRTDFITEPEDFEMAKHLTKGERVTVSGILRVSAEQKIIFIKAIEYDRVPL